MTKSNQKRAVPVEDPVVPVDRTLQAQTFTTANSPEAHMAHHSFQAASLPPATKNEPPRKKRGRPNKAEHERRVREAAERGEVYPSPKKTKISRQSLEGHIEELKESSAPERDRTGNWEPTKSASLSGTRHHAPEIPARTSSIEATASAAGKTQVERVKSIKETIPVVQASESPANEGVQSIRENATTSSQIPTPNALSDSALRDALDSPAVEIA